MRSYSHLSEDERDQIGVLRAAGRSMGAIARALGRAKATISRELQRNALPSGGYSPLHAAGAYQLRRAREAILEREAALRLFVGDRLAEGWTPEQISSRRTSGSTTACVRPGCRRSEGGRDSGERRPRCAEGSSLRPEKPILRSQ